MRKMIRRIEWDAGIPNLRDALVDRVAPTDLQSLLLDVYQERVKRRTGYDVFAEYQTNRFTRPASCDPMDLLVWDHVAFTHLPDGFHRLELSPVSPLGSVACLAPISQDWVLTTVRNVEVVADPTNVLALECARRRQTCLQSEPTDATPVHLACSHRVVRGQRYRSAEALSHFRLFSLCSAGRTTGSRRFELDAMTQHLRCYLTALRTYIGSDVPLRVTITDLDPETHDTTRLDVPLTTVTEAFDDVPIEVNAAASSDTTYYSTVRFHLTARTENGQELELVEGGDTDWTQTLLNNAKERLVISGLGSDRLCHHFTPVPQEPST